MSNHRNNNVAMIKTLGIVSAICGLIIVSAYQSTLKAVQNNKRIATERSIFKIFPRAQNIQAYVLENGAIEQSEDLPRSDFFAVYDNNNHFLGIAAQGQAKGYGDLVRLIFAYEPSCQCIRAIAVISMSETPGIGDKILTDKNFLANFEHLDARLNADLSALANAIVTVKNGTKENPWQIEAISGATITSRAVGKAINDSANILLPQIVPHLAQFSKKYELTVENRQEKENPRSTENIFENPATNQKGERP